MGEQKPLAVGDAVGKAKVVQIDVGTFHGAALLSDGRVVCWGGNTQGQCSVPEDLGVAQQVAVGRAHTAALCADGSVVCWGLDRDGQCQVPPSVGGATHVVAGESHTAALLADGRLACWGSNKSGQCEVPSDLGEVVRLAAGPHHTAALLADGRTRVWGRFGGRVPWGVSREQAMGLIMGLESTLPWSLINQLLASLPSDVVTHHTAGDNHVVALLADGRVMCWGENDDGQCDMPADLGPAVQVAAGASYTAALLADGRTRVWGRRCDDVPWKVADQHAVDLLVHSGSALTRGFGEQLLERFPIDVVKQTASGESHTVALLAGGRVICLGSSSSEHCHVPDDLGPAVQVAAGNVHTAALLADGGTRVWGRSCDGVPWEVGDEQAIELLVGSGASLTKEFGDQLLARLPKDAVKQAAPGATHGVALLSDGRVACWGENGSRQCEVPAGLAKVLRVAACSAQLAGRYESGSHTVALLADGRVVCWGENSAGQCDVPADLESAVSVGAGVTYTAALLADGRVVCWGSGGAIKVPKKLPKVTSIACGASHAVALSQDGRVLCWGSRAGGKCDVPESIQGRAAAVHADGASTWAVDVDGRLHGWGEIKKVDSLPFDLTDDAWLEFATRTWGQTKQKIYPEHIRKSAAFKAIRTMHTLAEG